MNKITVGLFRLGVLLLMPTAIWISACSNDHVEAAHRDTRYERADAVLLVRALSKPEGSRYFFQQCEVLKVIKDATATKFGSTVEIIFPSSEASVDERPSLVFLRRGGHENREWERIGGIAKDRTGVQSGSVP